MPDIQSRRFNRLPWLGLPMVLVAGVVEMVSASESAALPFPASDREAILAMTGTYDIDFSFFETVRYQPDYEHAEEKLTGGSEWVVVVEDSADKISLQHILVDPKSGYVTKHWRQDWIYEADTRFEFRTDQIWRVRELSDAETSGKWTQCVYEVSDAPRYCGTGKWIHEDGASTWTSDTTWRPLPRREYTTREDYNVMEAINRHTILADGWTHEQDNLKVQSGENGERHVIVREYGFNDYRDENEVDFTPAEEYWAATKDFWAQVRTRWGDYLDQPPGLVMLTGEDGMDMIMPLFEMAASVQEGETVYGAEIDAVFSDWLDRASAE